MGADHLKYGRSQMKGNSLSYEIFRVVNFFFEIGPGIAFGLRSNLCWTWMAFSLLSYLF